VLKARPSFAWLRSSGKQQLLLSSELPKWEQSF
jgi:hypothetical protein